MEESLSEARAALVKAKDDMSTYYNHWHEPAPIFAPGDKVYLDASDIHTTHPSQKLAHWQLGPYAVRQQRCLVADDAPTCTHTQPRRLWTRTFVHALSTLTIVELYFLLFS
jgi:hypothetical protein